MNQEKARRAAQALLIRDGIHDPIEVIGAFFPRGRALRQFIGMDVGSLAGDAIGGIGGAIGDAVGTIGGAEAGADYGERRTGLPPRVFLAVGRQGLYVFGAGKHGSVPLNFFTTLPLSTQVRVRRRLTVRVVELSDGSGQKLLEVEGPYGPLYAGHRTVTAIQQLSTRPRSAERA